MLGSSNGPMKYFITINAITPDLINLPELNSRLDNYKVFFLENEEYISVGEQFFFKLKLNRHLWVHLQLNNCLHGFSR